MDELLKGIYEVTVEMCRCLNEGQFEEFETLLEKRETLMTSVDELRNKEENYVYSSNQQQLLKDTYLLDQQLSPLIEKSLTETKLLITQQKKQKLIAQQYQTYSKQTNGIFLDSKR
jgi:hypothetical protein